MQSRVMGAAFKGSTRVVGDVLFTVPGLEHWDDGVRKFIRRRRARAKAAAGAAGAAPPELPPEAWLVRMFRSRTRVSIDKARRRLGYEPKYDFERGMALTAEYMRWANL
jgi:nucleoside-diphosphate-sugar epimerase